MKSRIKRLPFRREELLERGPQRTFSGKHLNQIAFPIGGIGTGSVSLSGTGALIDWEIFNRPNKGYRPRYSFISIWAKELNREPVFRILEGKLPAPYQGEFGITGRFGHGPNYDFAPGLPRFESNTFTGSYPFAEVNFKDKDFPLRISLVAFNPFIPLNDRDSSIPVLILKVKLKNHRRKKVNATLTMNLENVAGYPEPGKSYNRFRDDGMVRGLFMTSRKYPEHSPRYGSLSLATPWKDLTWQTKWYRGKWWDSLFHFLDTFCAKGTFENDDSADISPDNSTDIGSIGLRAFLKPGEEFTLPIVLAWHFPWFEKYWGGETSDCCEGRESKAPKWKNYYANLFADAWAAAKYTVGNLERLERKTRLYHDALFKSSLPLHVLDAVSSQTSTLKTTTCLRLPDGTLWGWEGCNSSSGCCEGSCTHVWNYAQTVAYLFPKLERSMREAEYNHGMREKDGHIQFRLPLPLGSKAKHDFHAAADGQLGGIIRIYREWKISGDDSWLRKLWRRVKKALEYAWVEWDRDRDGIIEGAHHNTYDIEFHGPETMSGSMYLGALRAGEEMARHLGEFKKAEEYRQLYESGRRKTDENLFNGEFYIQRIEKGIKSSYPSTDSRGIYRPDKGESSLPNYQLGNGCLIDQLIGQWYATMLGLGYIYKPANVKKALSSVLRYNWRSDFSSHKNPTRAFALNDDKGVLICSWPKGGRPEFPFPVCDEVMTGFEYQLASHLIYEGFILEGLSVVKAIRDRHDGFKRNPWNEFECGSHYVRSMASWAVLLALSGFSYSATDKYLGFNPKVNKPDFRCFFSVDSGWGNYQQKLIKKRIRIAVDILHGKLELSSLEAGGINIKSGGKRGGSKADRIKVTSWQGKKSIVISCDFTRSALRFEFKKPVQITPKQSLKIELNPL